MLVLGLVASLVASAFCVERAASRTRLVAFVVFFLAASAAIGGLLSLAMHGGIAAIPGWMRFGAGVALVLAVLDLAGGEPLDPELRVLVDDSRKQGDDFVNAK